MSPDPLLDTLFRGAAAEAATASAPLPASTPSTPSTSPLAPFAAGASAGSLASAPPVRAAGTRSRAGNAMDRTRVAVLDGARAAVVQSGVRITMSQVAAAAGVAKATLYNHFRTRDDVLAALVVDEVRRIATKADGRPLAEALEIAAISVASSPLLAAVARNDPGTLASLACIDPSTEGWRVAREAVAQALHAGGRAGSDTVLRLLASYIASPATPSAIAGDVSVLLAGLPRAGRADAVPSPSRSEPRPA